MSNTYNAAVTHMHAAIGCRVIASGTRKRGRQCVAWIFRYEGQDPAPRDNMTLTTGFPMYAPEIAHKYAVFLTSAEIKRRKKGEQA